MGQYSKAIVAAIGLVIVVLSTAAVSFSDLLSPTWATVISGVVAVLTAVSTYLVPNSELPSKRAPRKTS